MIGVWLGVAVLPLAGGVYFAVRSARDRSSGTDAGQLGQAEMTFNG